MSDLPPNKCPFCGQTFRSEQDLKVELEQASHTYLAKRNAHLQAELVRERAAHAHAEEIIDGYKRAFGGALADAVLGEAPKVAEPGVEGKKEKKS